jgi:hypothetical protein
MIKAFYCFNIILLLAMGGCKDPKKGADVLDEAIPEAPTGPTGSAAAKITPPINKTTELLMKSFWVFEHYVRPIDENRTVPLRYNKGIWFQFHPDGTYVSGKWQKALDKGTWFVNEGGNSALGRSTYRVFLDSEIDDSRDVEYEIQGLSKDGTYMSWVKVVANSVDQDAAMMKVLGMLSLPTPESIGVDSLGNPLN